MGFASAVTGTACTSFDANHVTFSLTAAMLSDNANPLDLRGASTLYAARIYVGTLQGGLIFRDPSTEANIIEFATAYECKKTYPDNL